MIYITLTRKSNSAVSNLQVDCNSTVYDVVQMGMFDVGSLNINSISVSVIEDGHDRYLPIAESLILLGFEDGERINLYISEISETKMANILQRYKEMKDDPDTLRLQALDRIKRDTFDAYPAMFMVTRLLYLRVVIGGKQILCLVDTGANHSVISIDTAKKCDLLELIDTRMKGKVVGVGEANVYGVIYNVDLHINEHVYPLSLSVLTQKLPGSIELILGLDMLRRHGCIIDLKRLELGFGDGINIPFMTEKESEEIEKNSQ